MELLEQCRIWHENDEHQKIIDALEAIPEGERTPEQDLELARAYRFGRWKTLSLVYVPSVLPYFASGCRTALGLAWKAGVAAEVLCLPKAAIGTQVYRAKITLSTGELFAWTFVIIVLSAAFEKLFLALLDKAVARAAGEEG